MHLVNDSEKYFNENIEIQKICSISVDTLLLTLWDQVAGTKYSISDMESLSMYAKLFDVIKWYC